MNPRRVPPTRPIARLAALLLAWALLGPAARAHAASAGAGTFGITVQPIQKTFQGTFTFTVGPLATSVGSMTFSGTLDNADLPTSSVEFDLAAAGGTALGFDASGVAVCSNPSCGAGTGTFVGRLSNLTGSTLPLGPDYRLDGTVALTGTVFQLTGTGTFGINAFENILTSAGATSNVPTGVQNFYNSVIGALDEFEVDIGFTNVPADCVTRVVGLSEVRGFPSALDRLGAFVNIVSDCSFDSASVCLHYDDENTSGIDESTLILVHRADAGTGFSDITTMRDPANTRICGTVSSFSPFAIGVIPPPSSSTTSSTTTSTTSTSTMTETTQTTESPSATSSTTTTDLPTTTSTTLLQLIGAKKMLVKGDPEQPDKGKLVFLAKSAVEAPEAANAPTLVSATLLVRDAGGQQAAIALPASGWTPIGGDGAKGFKYKDKKGAAGPCRTAVLKTGKQIKIACKGPGITLAPPLADPVDVTLQMGSRTYCAAFGGNITKNANGSFVGKAAAAPAQCGLRAPLSAAAAEQLD